MHGAVWMSFVGHFSSSVSLFALTRHIVTMGTYTYYNNIYGKTRVPFRLGGLNIIIL